MSLWEVLAPGAAPLLEHLVRAGGNVGNIAALGIAGYTAYIAAERLGNYSYELQHRFFPGQQTWEDKCQHGLTGGQPGAGKTTLCVCQGIEAVDTGHGLLGLDPHGTLAESLVYYAPKDRMVIYHKPAEAPLGFNPLYLETGSEAEKELVVDQFCQLLRGVTPGSWGHVQDAALSQALWRTLSEPYPNVRKLIENLPDNEGLKARVAMLLSAPTLDKMLNADPIPLRSLIVHGGVYLLNMGGMGKRSAAVCYRLHLLRLEQIALSLRLGEGKGCMLICDEIQRARQHAEGLADMLAELRKYGFAMLLAHHDTDQMSKELTHYYSLLGNHYLFRLNNKDAAAFADVTFPITPITVTHLSNYTCVRRRQVHGIAEQPRVVKTSLPPKRRLSDAEVQAIKTRSVEQYGATNRTRRTTVDSFRTQESSDYEPATEVLPGQKRRHIVRVHEEENATAGGRWVSEKLPSTDGKRGNEAMGDGVLPY